MFQRLGTEVGKKVKFENVLFYSDEKGHHFGKPQIKGASVTATVLDHNRERKILVYKKSVEKDISEKMDIVSGIQKLKLKLLQYQLQKKNFKTKKISVAKKAQKKINK